MAAKTGVTPKYKYFRFAPNKPTCFVDADERDKQLTDTTDYDNDDSLIICVGSVYQHRRNGEWKNLEIVSSKRP